MRTASLNAEEQQLLSDERESRSLVQGKVEIGDLSLCKVLLVDDSQYAGWLVLVPQQPDLTVRFRPSRARLQA